MSIIRNSIINHSQSCQIADIAKLPGSSNSKVNPNLAHETSLNKLLNINTKSNTSNYQQLKTLIHNRLIDRLDLNTLVEIDNTTELKNIIEQIIHTLINEEKIMLNINQRQNLTVDILNETLGLGPLEPLLADPTISDIMVNGPYNVYVDRLGKIEETNIHFKDNAHLLHIINRIVARVGRRIDESSPMADARLEDGSRVNAIIPPLSLTGPILSIRRFRPNRITMADLVNMEALSPSMSIFLEACVSGKLNILVSGGTSAGKTTLLNALSQYIGLDERTITIEDTAELSLVQKHVIQLESRPSNIEGVGAISQRDLVKNALRMRPDRIIIGEVRGAEAMDMLAAMNTGHEGSLTTCHANSSRDALARIETLVLLGQVELSQRSIREQMTQAFDLVIQVKRLKDGSRKIVSISEVTGMEGDTISMQDIFIYKYNTGHIACNVRPRFVTKFEENGIEIPENLFSNEA